MKEILISSAVFLACLLVAFISQVISPTSISAAQSNSTLLAEELSIDNGAYANQVLELDPDDPNPKLFQMANNQTKSENRILGSSIETKDSTVTSSGLRITEISIGSGAEATAGKKVSVNYRGSLENGKEFDSSYGRGPFQFTLGQGQVIKGWDEGVEGMKVEGKRKLVIPPELGYGSRGAGGGVIPPYATLIFEVELLEVR